MSIYYFYAFRMFSLSVYIVSRIFFSYLSSFPYNKKSQFSCVFLSYFFLYYFFVYFLLFFLFIFSFIFSILFFLCMHAYVYVCVRVFISRTSSSLICVAHLGCKAQDQRAQIPVAAIIPNNVLKSIAIIGSDMHIIQQSSSLRAIC